MIHCKQSSARQQLCPWDVRPAKPCNPAAHSRWPDYVFHAAQGLCSSAGQETSHLKPKGLQLGSAVHLPTQPTSTPTAKPPQRQVASRGLASSPAPVILLGSASPGSVPQSLSCHGWAVSPSKAHRAVRQSKKGSTAACLIRSSGFASSRA